jgi:hypothetical protein
MVDPSAEAPNTVEFHGSHGTTISSWEAISRTRRFEIGKGGRRGPGIYFWRRSRRWKELAERWYHQARAQGRYADQHDVRGCVIYVVARTDESRFLDLCDPEAVDAIDALAAVSRIDLWNTKAAANTYVMYVRKVEEKLGHPIGAFEAEVSPPDRDYYPDGKGHPFLALGLPRCYVVLDPAIIAEFRMEGIN